MSDAIEDESTETTPIDVTVRPYEVTDTGFLYKTWLRSYRPYRARTPDDMYYTNHQEIIRGIIQSPTASCVIACDAAKPEFIFGFCAAEALTTADLREPLLVHYLFTKLSYRGLGIARYMLDALGWHGERTVQCTHWTKFCRDTHAKYKLLENDYFLRGMQHGRYATYNTKSYVQKDGHASVGRTDHGQDATP